MTTTLLIAAHGIGNAPAWSPYAVAAGLLVGLVLGATTALLFALRLLRLERLAPQPDPAVRSCA